MFFSKERFVLCVYFHSLQKNFLFSVFISVLCKRHFVRCVHFRSLEKNGNERIILLGFVSCQKHGKRT